MYWPILDIVQRFKHPVSTGVKEGVHTGMGKRARIEVSAHHVANIVACVLDASEEEHAAGMLWYGSYGAAIVAYASTHGVARDTALAIFAALSPQTAIARNWTLYKASVANGSLAGQSGVLGHKRRKVDGLLNGTVSVKQATKGLKVSSFYANLSGGMHAVTIDRHAAACALRQPGPTKGVCATKYRNLEAAYQVAAAQLGLEPAQCQAIAWIVWRRWQGHKDGGCLHLVA